MRKCQYPPPACLNIPHQSPSAKAPVRSLSQPVLYFFMCRWTCSRCWKSAMMLDRLSRLLLNHHVAVVLVGDSHYLRPATRLAAELKLPFTLLGDDAQALRSAYGFRPKNGASHGQALLLLDGQGKALYCQDGIDNHLAFDLPRLKAAVKLLPKVESTTTKIAVC